MLGVGVAGMLGASLAALNGSRQVGQTVIGSALGLRFSPEVLTHVSDHLVLVVSTALGSVLIGIAGAILLSRMANVQPSTAFFSAMPGGAAEMSTLAYRWGARQDYVAAAQVMRVVLVVLTIPATLLALGTQGDQLLWAHHHASSIPHAVSIMAAALAGGLLLTLIRFPNAWMLGPLLAVGMLSALSYSLAPVPVWMTDAAQLLIGITLGVRFGKEFVNGAPRFLIAVALTTVLAMLLSVAMAMIAAQFGSIPNTTLVLATAPGGIAEMSLVAASMHLAVPVVVVCHVSRLIALMMFAQPLYRVYERYAGAPIK